MIKFWLLFQADGRVGDGAALAVPRHAVAPRHALPRGLLPRSTRLDDSTIISTSRRRDRAGAARSIGAIASEGTA